uniref:MATH domain-containing protein n=1 Tax=Angiostrongylus cantonensis TaxID=6313 RepID=A0A158PB92_ANGCA
MTTPTDRSIDTDVTTPCCIGFCYEWNTKISMRPVSDDDSVILIVSPKFATVYDHVSFQWSLKIHGMTGRLDDDVEDEDELPSDYVAVELYYVDGPVSQENVGMIVKVSVLIKMDAKLFDPYTYLDNVFPTPQKSFLTTNYNARVNSKVWRRRSKKKSTKDENGKVSRKEKIDIEKKFAEVMEQERERMSETNRLRVTEPSSRRGSSQTPIALSHSPDHEHLFKKTEFGKKCRRYGVTLYNDLGFPRVSKPRLEPKVILT